MSELIRIMKIRIYSPKGGIGVLEGWSNDEKIFIPFQHPNSAVVAMGNYGEVGYSITPALLSSNISKCSIPLNFLVYWL